MKCKCGMKMVRIVQTGYPLKVEHKYLFRYMCPNINDFATKHPEDHHLSHDLIEYPTSHPKTEEEVILKFMVVEKGEMIESRLLSYGKKYPYLIKDLFQVYIDVTAKKINN